MRYFRFLLPCDTLKLDDQIRPTNVVLRGGEARWATIQEINPEWEGVPLHKAQRSVRNRFEFEAIRPVPAHRVLR